MKEEAFKKILDREGPREAIEKNFKESIELLQEIANYGTNLIPRCFVSSEKTLTDIIILGDFLKHAVAMIDAVEILVSQGAVMSAQVPARSLWETSLYILWILSSDADRRAKQYYVWDLRRQQYWAKRIIPGTKEREAFQTTLEKISSIVDPDEEKQKMEEAKKQIANIDKILGQSEFRDINDEFDKIKKRQHDEPWYKPGGPSSLKDMANRLGLNSEWELFYTQFSEISHAQALRKHIRFKKNEIVFEPIRYLEGIDVLLRMTLSFAIRTYRTILQHYRPEELTNFGRKYLTEWRERFWSIKGVNYKVETSDPI